MPRRLDAAVFVQRAARAVSMRRDAQTRYHLMRALMPSTRTMQVAVLSAMPMPGSIPASEIRARSARRCAFYYGALLLQTHARHAMPFYRAMSPRLR